MAALGRWSPYRLWLALCGRRLWLSETLRLGPPETRPQIIGAIVHKLITKSIINGCRYGVSDILEYITSATQSREISSHVITYLDSFYSILANESNVEYLGAEMKVQTVVDTNAYTVSIDEIPKPGEERQLSHILWGRVDAVCRFTDTLIIRDFKLNYDPTDEKIAQIRKQVGLYRICLRPNLDKFKCRDIRCEIVDLHSGKVEEIEPYHTGDMFQFVKEAELRGRKVKYKSQCSNCPFTEICDFPEIAPTEWKRKYQHHLSYPV